MSCLLSCGGAGLCEWVYRTLWSLSSGRPSHAFWCGFPNHPTSWPSCFPHWSSPRCGISDLNMFVFSLATSILTVQTSWCNILTGNQYSNILAEALMPAAIFLLCRRLLEWPVWEVIYTKPQVWLVWQTENNLALLKDMYNASIKFLEKPYFKIMASTMERSPRIKSLSLNLLPLLSGASLMACLFTGRLVN